MIWARESTSFAFIVILLGANSALYIHDSRSVSVVKRRRVAPPSIARKGQTLGDLVRL